MANVVAGEERYVYRTLVELSGIREVLNYLFSFLNPLYETSVFKNELYLLTSFSTAGCPLSQGKNRTREVSTN